MSDPSSANSSSSNFDKRNSDGSHDSALPDAPRGERSESSSSVDRNVVLQKHIVSRISRGKNLFLRRGFRGCTIWLTGTLVLELVLVQNLCSLRCFDNYLSLPSLTLTHTYTHLFLHSFSRTLTHSFNHSHSLNHSQS